MADGSKQFDSLYTIKDDGQHMVALSSVDDQISVWHVGGQKARMVRTLKGSTTDLRPSTIRRHSLTNFHSKNRQVFRSQRTSKWSTDIARWCCAIANYDFTILIKVRLRPSTIRTVAPNNSCPSAGTLLTKLKGVMNQKMPFYGLHGDRYCVALSRNRMYVNFMNLDTGDLETTFKVGEDRFLNSLLVSANGKVNNHNRNKITSSLTIASFLFVLSMSIVAGVRLR